MFKLKTTDGQNNICGQVIRQYRMAQTPPISQRKLAEKLQLAGYDVDNHFIRRIELGERFVTDIELKMFAQELNITLNELLNM